MVDGPRAGAYILAAVTETLDERAREVLRLIVDSYMASGDPVSSRTISRRMSVHLSSATVRNVMADLEEAGLLYAPHTSAGRLPTDPGLRLFVDGLLEVGNISKDERKGLDAACAASGASLEAMLEDVTVKLSGLSGCAGMVMAPKADIPLRHIEFVSLSPGRALVVLVTETGVVENRILEVPPDLPPSALVEATNYLSARLVGRMLADALDDIRNELQQHRAQLDALSRRVVEAGLATWAGGESNGALIVRGQANLLAGDAADLEQIRALFQVLEKKETMVRLLGLADGAEGVQIFIGADNQLFGVSGCSLIVGPYRDTKNRVMGAIGVIGPTRMNYARIIPMVDYTSKLIGRLLGGTPNP